MQWEKIKATDLQHTEPLYKNMVQHHIIALVGSWDNMSTRKVSIVDVARKLESRIKLYRELLITRLLYVKQPVARFRKLSVS